MYIYTVSICSEKAVRAAASQIIGIQGSIVLKSNKPRQIARATGSFFDSVATGSWGSYKYKEYIVQYVQYI